MSIFKEIKYALRITDTYDILRRYFVVNGFDGALTMLGLILGFLVSSPAEIPTIINACLGVAIALGVSGISSAYISEHAELKHSLGKLEHAMVKDLQSTAHGKAARWAPIIIAFVNGSSPFIISLLIISPLWLSNTGLIVHSQPLYLAILVALVIIFLLGVFLGRIAEISLLRSGLQTLVVALVTAALIYLVT